MIIGEEDRIAWVKHTRLLGVTIDDRLSWSNDVKKCFVNKLNLLKRSLFLGRESLLDLHSKVIVSSILYGRVAWSSSVNVEQL